MSDPFESLADSGSRRSPHPEFARDLRSRLVAALDLTVQLPERKTPMNAPTTTPSTTPTTTPARRDTHASALIPYLAVAGASDAVDWYGSVFGAVETMRIGSDDGRVGHAELTIGDVTIYLADEFPEIGHVAPTTLGGTAAALHLTVDDVDATYARAVASGATGQREPADQPHGNRQGSIVDPFGHRWLLSQPLGAPAPARTAARGAVWPALNYADAREGIRFLTEVLGFETELVVADDRDPATIHHSELRWPDGGIVQIGSAGPRTPYSAQPTGSGSLYLVTADPQAVWDRCQAEGVEVVTPPYEPEYAPGTMMFGIRDFEGNLFSFGQYAGDPVETGA